VLKSRFKALHVGLFFRFDEAKDMEAYTSFVRACCIVNNICLRFRDVPSERDVEEAINAERALRARDRAAALSKVHPAVELGSLELGKKQRRILALRIVGREITSS
jgi:hypothetical protein